MDKHKQKMLTRSRRRQRSRAKVRGTAERPRLAFFRSNKNVYAQIIDDTAGRTLVGSSSLKSGTAGSLAAAREMGSAIAGDAVKQGVTKVVFDRGGFTYTGAVQAFADAARSGGLQF